MAPKMSPQSTLTKAEGLLFLIATRLLTAFRYKEANPGGDFSHFLGNIEEEMKKIKDISNKYQSTPPSIRHRYHTIIKTVALEWESAVEERRTFNFDRFTGKHIDKYCARTASDHPEWPAILYSMDLSKDAAEQSAELQWWIPRPDGEGEHASPSPPPPAPHPPPLRRSARTTKEKSLLPLYPLDIKVGDDQTRVTNRSATYINEASDNDQGGVDEPPPRKVVTPAGRSTTRVTFLSPRESRLEKRRRVDDGLKNTEATQVAGWVAVGEDRCNPCKLVGRETCIPEQNAGKSCIFCTGQSWSCNPPDSWLEMVSHPKQARPKPHNDVPIEVGGSSKRAAKATHHSTEVEMAQRSGHQRGGEVAHALDLEDLLEDLDLEELVSLDPSTKGLDLSAKKQMVARMKQIVAKMKQRSAKMKEDLAALELNLHNIKLMARALCSHHGITFPHHLDPTLDHEDYNSRTKIADYLSAISRTLRDVNVLLRAVCDHQGITISLRSDLTATAASTSIHPVAPSPVTKSPVHNLAPQYAGAISIVRTEDEEPSQEAASQTSGLKRQRPDELMDTSSTSGLIRCESRSHRKVKCAQCKGKKPSNQVARYQDSNHPYEHSTPAPARGRRKGTPANRESTAQSSRLALSITDPDELLSIDLPGIDPAITTLCWRMELVRARAAYEVADAHKEFVEEKYEQSLALEQAAALGQSTAAEPRAKRGKTNTSRKGKR